MGTKTKLTNTTAMTQAAPDSPGAVTDEPERKKIANRLWIGDDGKECDEDKATGVSYQFLGREKDGVTTPGDPNPFTLKFAEMSEAEKNMYAGFGALTLYGNLTNTWLGEKGDRAASPIDVIRDRATLIRSGQWIDRTAVGVGAKVDKPALAKAIVQVYAAEGKTVDEAAILAKLEADADVVRTARAVPAIATAYAALVGRTVKTVDDLSGALGV